MAIASLQQSQSIGRTKVRGFVPPIITPFRNGAIDVESLRRVLDDLGGSVSGVLVGGSVGETASLSVAERITIIHEVANNLKDDAFLAVSIASNSLADARHLSEAASEVGADLLVASCPNYYTNDRQMLIAYFGALAEFASADLCLYDNPVASHTTLSVEDIKVLAREVPKLTHIKVADTSLEKVEALRWETNLGIFAGDDVVLWQQLTRGAEGAMVAIPLIYPDRAAAFWAAFSYGDYVAAQCEYRRMSHFIHISLGAPDYVSVIKTVLYHRGVIASAEVRAPLLPLTPSRQEEVIASLYDG